MARRDVDHQPDQRFGLLFTVDDAETAAATLNTQVEQRHTATTG